MYEFRQKYKKYLRIKPILRLSIIAPFTGNELSKMTCTATLGSKAVCYFNITTITTKTYSLLGPTIAKDKSTN